MSIDHEQLQLQILEGIASTNPNLEHRLVECTNIGPINVYVQGVRSTAKEVVILTVHDLGCDHTMYQEFVDHPKMVPIRDRVIWVHVDVPGQGQDAPDLPADYQFPTMQEIGEDLIHVLDQLKLKEVVCFGEGAGANILARFAMAHIERVMGVCLLHTTGNAAGFLESVKDKLVNWKLENVGMNSSTENYLVLHRFGGVSKNFKITSKKKMRRSHSMPQTENEFKHTTDKDDLKVILESYHETLYNKANAKNLQKFVDAFLKRTSLADNIKILKCPILLVTGQQSVFNNTTRSLHQAILKSCMDKTKVEFIEVGGVANVIEEKPDKLAESFQYFLQGLGLVSSVPMHNVHKMLRNRTMSMEDYDKPLKERINSFSCSTPTSDKEFELESPGSPGSPPATDPSRESADRPLLAN